MNYLPVQVLLSRVWQQLPPPVGSHSDFRVGVDVVDVEVLRRQIKSEFGPDFVNTRFTAQEVEDARGRSDRLASRWAIKEAVAKAIGTGFREGLKPGSIEVVTEPSGAVTVRPSSGAVWPRDAANWTWAVSASHESDVAAAIAIALPRRHEREEC